MQKESIRKKTEKLFDMPMDTGGGVLHVEISGRSEIFVENHKGIFELGENEVILNSDKGSLRILGQKLSVLAMNRDEIRLSGRIESVSFEREE